eukprot:GHRQ01010299.1.p2 GENE.GHRQ01010299.1~~GHRQ01010299.1.p2  ORF type:complete len:153 (+),score=10.72 GHRQ01010299.1:105-563(+)
MMTNRSCQYCRQLPAPIAHNAMSRAAKIKRVNLVCDKRSKNTSSSVTVAPCQAVAVCSPPITHHRAEAVEVLEPYVNIADEDRLSAIQDVLQNYTKKLSERTKYFLGYPCNLDYDYGALEGLSKYSINNAGDPFIEGNYGLHLREFEVAVLD